MGIKGWWDKKKQQWDEEAKLDQVEKEKREAEFKQFQGILDKFEIPQLKIFCENFLGTSPPEEIEQDEENGRKRVIKPDRKTHIDFIIDYYQNGQLKLEQLKDYALNHKILSRNYFGVESDEVGEKREFENIMNAIRAHFQPENIYDEKELQAQLTIFLKAKFPDKKIEREVSTRSGYLDIVVDNKYVFELKVPKQRTDLRNLTAQLEEYSEEYPYLCAVIADNSGNQKNDVMVIEPKMAETIKEYVDRYKAKLGIPSLVFDVNMRG